MQVKLFGDTKAINLQGLGIGMPFAPLYQLARQYHLEKPNSPQITLGRGHLVDIQRTFETKKQLTKTEQDQLLTRIRYRTRNTVSALEQCSADSICINIGGGMHHSGKYPNTGYAYSLINDIIWAVDYQLEQNPSIRIGIIDLDFHFGGGTWEYYVKNHNPHIYISDLFHKQGVLHQHQYLVEEDFGLEALEVPYLDNMAVDKVILNIGTDWYQDDILFGKYGSMCSADLIDVWWDTVRQITVQGIPVCVTMGGGYGTAGLMLYEEFISGLELMRV